MQAFKSNLLGAAATRDLISCRYQVTGGSQLDQAWARNSHNTTMLTIGLIHRSFNSQIKTLYGQWLRTGLGVRVFERYIYI